MNEHEDGFAEYEHDSEASAVALRRVYSLVAQRQLWGAASASRPDQLAACSASLVSEGGLVSPNVRMARHSSVAPSAVTSTRPGVSGL